MGFFDSFFKNNPQKEKEDLFKFESQRLIQIVTDSMDIINNTKNVNTAIGRFDTISQMVRRLSEIKPATSDFKLKLEGNDLLASNGIEFIEDFKGKWILNFFTIKINTELDKADLLSDKKLKVSQLKKALKIALDSISYLPDSAAIRPIIVDIELKITQA